MWWLNRFSWLQWTIKGDVLSDDLQLKFLYKRLRPGLEMWLQIHHLYSYAFTTYVAFMGIKGWQMLVWLDVHTVWYVCLDHFIFHQCSLWKFLENNNEINQLKVNHFLHEHMDPCVHGEVASKYTVNTCTCWLIHSCIQTCYYPLFKNKGLLARCSSKCGFIRGKIT